MKKIVLGFAALSALIFTSCSNDDDVKPPKVDGPVVITAPATYAFERNGNSNVSFGGQTTRIKMAKELGSALKDNSLTEMQLDGMFAHEEGNADFEDADLNASGKSIRSKVAASIDYFSANTTDAMAIKKYFDDLINLQVSEVFPNWDMTASAGVAGGLDQLDGKTRYINAKGLEYDQAVTKGLIGALMMDQFLNNYMSTAVLDAGDNRANNDNDVLEEGKDYTLMEHKWDEGYGYLYGNEADPAVPSDDSADDFLNKYVKRAADNGFPDLPNEVYTALKLGRAAIVGKDYALRDEQIVIIKEKISMAIALRAVNYLQAGKADLFPTTVDQAHGFYRLSEAIGFIYSLQFTRKPDSNAPYFTKVEVEGFIDQLLPEQGNGFWDIAPATLDQISDTIAAKFEFTVAQAAM
ncbi:FIG00930717: hypothetical protein [hydrothermal vent metagenome]|uniref:DUF4856 domain-containing protein n=1 Tax=hydrothermal vent metagenome TaxID=652676 RepID=A0A3B0SU98_9ZZZZ